MPSLDILIAVMDIFLISKDVGLWGEDRRNGVDGER